MLPSLAMLLAFVVSIGGMQLLNLRLLAASSWAARESAMNEHLFELEQLSTNLEKKAEKILGGNAITLKLLPDGDFICVKASREVGLLWNESRRLLLEQQSCSRRQANP